MPGPAQDGNEAASFTDQEVSNVTGPPTVSAVELVSTPTVDANGDNTAETYAVGNEVRAQVTFSQPVDVAGIPELKLQLAADPADERSMTFDTTGSGRPARRRWSSPTRWWWATVRRASGSRRTR